MTVAEAFCARQKCPPAHYPDRAFRQCLYTHATPVALLLRSLSPRLFHEDQQVIHQVGLAHNLEEVDAVLSDFQYVNTTRRHWLRTGLKIRISGRKLRLLAASVLEDAHRPDPASSPRSLASETIRRH
jgi:hypothetical protein